MTTLKQRFALLAQKKPEITQADLARATGAKASSVSDWFSGETKSMKAGTAAKAAQLYGCETLWLSNGTGPIWPAASSSITMPMPIVQASGGPSTLRIPVLANDGSMGFGSDVHDEDVVVGDLALSPKWVSDTLHPSKPVNMRFIHGYGDSMIPTFNSGDVLLVDTGVQDARIDGIYTVDVIAHEGEFWLVPEWLDNPSTGLSKPARIVRLKSVPHRECLGHSRADFLIPFGVPKAAIFGPYPSPGQLPLDWLEAPDIQVLMSLRH